MRKRIMGLVALAAVGVAVAVPLAFSAEDAPQAASTEHAAPAAPAASDVSAGNEKPEALAATGTPAKDSAEDEVSAKKVTRAYVFNGHASFESYGEHLFACDDGPDDLYVKAQAMWDHKIQASVVDTNGFGGGCEEVNLSIREGQDVNIRACLETDFGWTCGDWVDSEA
jgi:hypothetical protein